MIRSPSSSCSRRMRTQPGCLPSLTPKMVIRPTAYGLCDIGIGMPELGAVKISDLASIVGPFKLPIERDLYFTAKRTLSEYTRLARINCSIID